MEERVWEFVETLMERGVSEKDAFVRALVR